MVAALGRARPPANVRLAPRLCKAVAIGLAILVTVVVMRAMFPEDLQLHPERMINKTQTHWMKATPERINRLRAACQIPSISTDIHKYDTEQLIRLREHIRDSFPLIHQATHVSFEIVNGYSLLYTWQGKNASLDPALLAAHLDVVPISKPDAWVQPPFGGNIQDDFLYCRGILDDKGSLFSILEAIEDSLRRNGLDFQPHRTVLAAFGHDEEVSGLDGAMHIARLLSERYKQLEFVLDEGLPISDGLLPGIDSHLALIGVAEKGFLNLELSVSLGTEEAGHSSRPPSEQAISILSKAILNLKQNPPPLVFTPVLRELLRHGSTYCNFVARIFTCNLWLFEPLLKWLMSFHQSTETLVRTTTAFTMLQSGIKANVLPHEAKAVVNFRLITGTSVAETVEHVRWAIGDDRVHLRVMTGDEPSPVSSCESFGFDVVQNSVRQVFKGVGAVPGLMIGGTDTKAYVDLAKDIYRFSPVVMEPVDVSRLHGPNERLSIPAFENMLNFYANVLDNLEHFHRSQSAHRDPAEL